MSWTLSVVTTRRPEALLAAHWTSLRFKVSYCLISQTDYFTSNISSSSFKAQQPKRKGKWSHQKTNAFIRCTKDLLTSVWNESFSGGLVRRPDPPGHQLLRPQAGWCMLGYTGKPEVPKTATAAAQIWGFLCFLIQCLQ